MKTNDLSTRRPHKPETPSIISLPTGKRPEQGGSRWGIELFANGIPAISQQRARGDMQNSRNFQVPGHEADALTTGRDIHLPDPVRLMYLDDSRKVRPFGTTNAIAYHCRRMMPGIGYWGGTSSSSLRQTRPTLVFRSHLLCLLYPKASPVCYCVTKI